MSSLFKATKVIISFVPKDFVFQLKIAHEFAFKDFQKRTVTPSWKLMFANSRQMVYGQDMISYI